MIRMFGAPCQVDRTGRVPGLVRRQRKALLQRLSDDAGGLT
jgi:hypothetical protein